MHSTESWKSFHIDVLSGCLGARCQTYLWAWGGPTWELEGSSHIRLAVPPWCGWSLFHPGHYKVCPPEDFQMYCATVFFNLEGSELFREFRVGPPQLVIIPEDFWPPLLFTPHNLRSVVVWRMNNFYGGDQSWYQNLLWNQITMSRFCIGNCKNHYQFAQ